MPIKKSADVKVTGKGGLIIKHININLKTNIWEISNI